MAIDSSTGTRQDRHDAAGDTGRTGGEAQQETTDPRQDQALERERADPSAEEAQVRREQGGHDRPVGADGRPHPRPEPAPKGGR